MTPAVSVVVPVCNEAENVAPLAREIDAALSGRDYEMLFVDDGSTDATVAELVRLRSEGLATLRILRHSFRSGQSAAVATTRMTSGHGQVHLVTRLGGQEVR